MKNNIDWSQPSNVNTLQTLLDKEFTQSYIAQQMGTTYAAVKKAVHGLQEGHLGRARKSAAPDARKHVAKHKPAPKTVAKPVPKAVSVEEFIAKNGVRKFEPGATSNYNNVRDWLDRECGITIKLVTNRGSAKPYRLGHRKLNDYDLFKIYDSERIKRGLQPIIGPNTCASKQQTRSRCNSPLKRPASA